MVLLITTSRILSAIESIPPSRREELNLPSSPTSETPVSHEQVICVARYFRNEHGHEHGNAAAGNENESDKVQTPPSSSSSWSLNELLRGTKVYVPPPPKKPEPSHEYLAQKAKLLAALEKDAYNRLISPGLSSAANANIGPSPIFSSSTPTVSALHDSTHPYQDAVAVEDPLTPSLVLNIFLSILITGFSVYWALTSFRTPDFVLFFSKNRDIQSSTPGGTSEPIRVLLSLFAALGVGVAEVVIYAFYLRKVNEARMRERKIKERKEVVGSVEVGGVGGVKEVEVETETKEEIEIWGRGVNGGVRRRVRERWKEKEESKR